MARYTYYGFNLTSGDILAELPLRGAAPQWAVNDPGDLGGASINLNGLTAARLADIRTATVPYKCGVVVERDTTIVWSGIITARRYDSETGVWTLTVPGLLAYWRRRQISDNQIYTGMEQFDIVADLLRLGGDPTVPLIIDYTPSGVTRDLNIDATNQTTVLDEILQLADNLNGYELAIDTSWMLGGVQRVQHKLRIGSPYVGRRASSGLLLMLEYPGNVRKYTWDEDGEQFATDIYGVSTATDGTTLTRYGVNNTLLTEGFPRVASARQWDNITVSNTLDDHVVQALIEGNGYSDAPTFVVLDGGDTAIGSWVVGDDVRLRIDDPRRFSDPSTVGLGTAGLDTVVRLQSATVSPDDGTVALTAFAFTEAVQ